jgi:hypothetical protein
MTSAVKTERTRHFRRGEGWLAGRSGASQSCGAVIRNQHGLPKSGFSDSASTLSPAVLAIRPRRKAIRPSRMPRRWVKSLSVPNSSALMRRLYPSTSAAKIATSLRSVSPVLVKTRPRTAPDRLPRVRWREHLKIPILRLDLGETRMSGSGQKRS